MVLAQVRFVPKFEGHRVAELEIAVRQRGLGTVEPAGRPVRQVSYDEQEGQKYLAALVGAAEIAYWHTDAEGQGQVVSRLAVDAGQTVTQVRVGRGGTVIASTGAGAVYHWDPPPDQRLTDVSKVSDTPVTALEWLLGGRSFLAGTARGEVSAWFQAPAGADGALAMVRGHAFAPHAAVLAVMGLTEYNLISAPNPDSSAPYILLLGSDYAPCFDPGALTP